MSELESFWQRNGGVPFALIISAVLLLFGPTVAFKWLWLDVRSVVITEDMRVVADRKIQRDDAHMSFRVDIRKAGTHGVVCQGEGGPFPYQKEANARNPLVMDFWKWSGIKTDEQREYCRSQGFVAGVKLYAITCHYAHSPWGMIWGSRCVTSTPFVVPEGYNVGIGTTIEEQRAIIEDLKGRIVGRTPAGWHREDMAEWVKSCVVDQGECDPHRLPSYLERIEQ